MKRAYSSYSSRAKFRPAKYKKSGFKDKIGKELSNERVHLVKRHSDYLTIPLINTTPTYGALVFRLSNVPGNSEFINLYDQYKICGVKITFYPSQTGADTTQRTASAANPAARLLTAVDYNDSTVPLSLDDLRQYESCKVSSICEKHVRYISKPKFVNNSGQTVNDWISVSSATTIHYGLKYGAEPSGTDVSATTTFNIEVLYYLCFKNIK